MVPVLLYVIPNVDVPYLQKIQSGLQTVNRTVQSTYVNRNNSSPFRVLQVVNVNVLPLRKQSEFPKERDVESVEDQENFIPQFDNEGQTQVDVFFNSDGKYIPPQRIRGIRDYTYSIDNSKDILKLKENKMKLFLPFTKYDTSPITDTYIEQLVDFILIIVNKDIHYKNLDEIKIPHVHKDFTNKLGPIQVSGSFDATDGTFRNLSTIFRTEAVTVSRVGDSLNIGVGLGLHIMNFNFVHYEIQWSELEADGTIKGTCSSNSINVQVTINLNDKHCVQLHSLKIDNLGDIDVQVSNLHLKEILKYSQLKILLFVITIVTFSSLQFIIQKLFSSYKLQGHN